MDLRAIMEFIFFSGTASVKIIKSGVLSMANW